MTYTANTPLISQNISVTQPLINANFTVLDTYTQVNHVALNAINAGKHKFVQMPVQTVIPGGLTTGEGTLYTKTSGSTPELYYTPSNTSREYQLTYTASNTNFAAATNGWTFLPGGMILQYGSVASPTTGTVNFPITFPTAIYSIQLTLVRTSSSSVQSAYVNDASAIGPSSFAYTTTGSSNNQLFWMAIGK
jgi:hypothetical protein